MTVGVYAQGQVIRVWWHAPHDHAQHHGPDDHHGHDQHGPGSDDHHHDDMGDLVIAWEDGYRMAHPEVTFENSQVGNEAGIGGLYAGAADLAMMDRPPLAIEVDGYQQGEGHDPTGIAVATGSVHSAHHAPALAIVVAPGNPITSMTLAQLDAVFDADHRRGMERVHTWGDLGLTGEWAGRPVHLYGFGLNQDESFLFERDVMNGSQKWREGLHEADTPQAVSAAVAKDPNGIGITSLDGAGSAVKVLAVQDDQGNVVQPTPETLREGRYALERHVYAYFNRDKKDEFATVQKFVEYCLSDKAQAMAQSAGFLPLSSHVAAESREAVK